MIRKIGVSIVLFSLIAVTVQSQDYYIVIKAIKDGQQCVAAISANYISNNQTTYLGAEHFIENKYIWNQLKDCPSCCPITHEIESQNEEQVVHVCCSMILHGTCPHQGTLILDPSLQFQDGLLVSEDMLVEVNLEAISNEELDEFAQMKRELAMLDNFPTDHIPQSLLRTEPPSWLYGKFQQVGIALLLKYVAIRAYIGDLINKMWH